MEPEKAGTRRSAAQVWADARAGVIGGIAWVVVVSAAIALVGVLAGDVPAWLLPIAFVLGAAVPTLALSAVRRRYDTQSGRVEELRRRVEDADRRVAEGESDRDVLRQRLVAASAGQTPVSERGQGFVRRIRALRESAEVQMTQRHPSTSYASGLETQHLLALVDEMSEIIGPSASLRIARDHWSSDHHTDHDSFLTTLGQLEALATSWGVEDALGAP